MITAGVDCGAKNTKVVLCEEGKVLSQSLVLTGFDQKAAAEEAALPWTVFVRRAALTAAQRLVPPTQPALLLDDGELVALIDTLED